MSKILTLIAKLNFQGEEVPEWVLLFAAGWNTLDDGSKFFVDQAAFEQVQAFMDHRGNEIHWDYEHASIQDRAKIADGAPAAGWIKELAWVEGEGIMARMEWTKKAAGHLKAKEYKYFSPVFGVKKTDKRVCYLDSVALTNRPRTNNLTPIMAALVAAAMGACIEEDSMTREQLIEWLGLKADATDQEITLAIAALGIVITQDADPVIPEGVIAALGLKETDTESTVVASIHALKQTAQTSVSPSDFKALEDRLAKRDADDAVAAAMKSGKIAPAQKDWATKYATDDLDGFNTFVAKAPAVVPLDQLPGKTEKADKSGELNDTDRQVAAMMDVSDEDMKTYGLEVKNG